jgi:hypothetical protein
MKPKIEITNSYPVSIFIAGSYEHALICARAYCDEVGYCVTVTPTKYVYTDGEESGVIVGLINYPRFPASKEKIMDHAERLAYLLCEELKQKSFSIQNSEKTTWYSFKTEDIIGV